MHYTAVHIVSSGVKFSLKSGY